MEIGQNTWAMYILTKIMRDYCSDRKQNRESLYDFPITIRFDQSFLILLLKLFTFYARAHCDSQRFPY